MKGKLIILLAVAAAIVFLLLAWFVPVAFHLKETNLWILRIGILVLGAIICIALVVWARSGEANLQGVEGGAKGLQGALPLKAPAIPAAPAGIKAPAMAPVKLPASQGSDEIDVLAREAESRLQSSQLGRGASLRKLPLILLMGPAGSGKTNAVSDSGLDPELLAGEVTKAGALVPTRAANFWYARQMLFVEAGGAVTSQPERWVRLVRRLAPAQLMSVFGGQGQAPRAFVVCVSCEDFMKAGGAEALAADLQARLREAAQVLGSSFPVYVLFTKLDSLRFFTDFAANFSADESAEVLGTTLSAQPAYHAGVYAEEETKRLSAAFDSLFLSLSDRRPPLLRNEYDDQKLPGIYEFPREYRKLRNPLVQFLVDLCRPSQLRAGPFLRGFYFAGTRTVMTSSPAPAAEPVQAPEVLDSTLGATRVFSFGKGQAGPTAAQPAEGGATKVFDMRSMTGQGAGQGTSQGMSEGMTPGASQSRLTRVPVFLPHVFTDILLQDRSALGTSGSSARVSFWRRGLLAAVSLALLVWCVGLIVSYFGNRKLEADVQQAAATIPTTELSAGQLPTIDALKSLDNLRHTVATLGDYELNGAPWRLRWGLYSGHELYPAARALYFNRFHSLLFAQTQNSLLASLRQLPDTPPPGADYKSAYENLKAYLITTSNHDKSTLDFLPPVLDTTWIAGRSLDPQVQDLAQKQFVFYTGELKAANPYSSTADLTAVTHAREYLSHFAGTERVYQSMLAAAAAKSKSLNFNRDFPGSAETVVNRTEISGAYTKNGWAAMQDALKNPQQYFSGEEWVLGPQTAANISGADLKQTLETRYKSDYINQWRTFLKNTSIVHYANLADASRKLDALSGNKSPILELFWMVSQNTAVDPDVAKAFQPVQSVVPASSQNQYVGTANKPYVDALLNLKTSVDQGTQGPGANLDAAAAQISSSATNARTATAQIAQGFAPDPAGHVDDTVKRLMLEPIVDVEAAIPTPGEALNGKGPALCSQFGSLDRKFPFNPNSSTQATLQEFNSVFQPGTGTLWTFYNTNLKTLLIQQGSEYAAAPGSKVKLNPSFVRFFNRAAAVSSAVYPNGSQQPKLAFTLAVYPVEGLPSMPVTAVIEGQTLSTSGGSAESKQFVWPGATQGVSVSGNVGGTQLNFISFQGPWALFEFFLGAESVQPSGSGYFYAWTPKTGSQPITVSNRPVRLRFNLNMGGAPPIFERGYLAGLGCTSRIVVK